MKFKTFTQWCDREVVSNNYNTIDQLKFLIECQKAIFTIKQRPFWKRESFWRSYYEPIMVKRISDYKHRKYGE